MVEAGTYQSKLVPETGPMSEIYDRINGMFISGRCWCVYSLTRA